VLLNTENFGLIDDTLKNAVFYSNKKYFRGEYIQAILKGKHVRLRVVEQDGDEILVAIE
jgi:hypothetical protein